VYYFRHFDFNLEIRDVWRPGAGLAGTRDSVAQIRDISGYPGRVATLSVTEWPSSSNDCHRCNIDVRASAVEWPLRQLNCRDCNVTADYCDVLISPDVYRATAMRCIDRLCVAR